MTVVKNMLRHPFYLTGGDVLAPGEQSGDINVGSQHEQDAIADGSLLVINLNEVPPEAGSTPFSNVNIYVGQTEPAPNPDTATVFFHTDPAGQNLLALKLIPRIL